METGKSVLQLHISFKYRWSIGVLLEMTALVFLDQSKTSIMGFIFSFLNVSDSFIWRKHIFLDQNNKFLLWLTSSSNKHTVASNMFFSSSQTETISLSVQSLLTVCNHQTLTFSIFFFYQSKKKEEKRSMLFFFWQKKNTSISVQSYSVHQFLHVDMASHQQGQTVPLLRGHGAEHLGHICLDHVRGFCGAAVTQVDQPGQYLFQKH